MRRAAALLAAAMLMAVVPRFATPAAAADAEPDLKPHLEYHPPASPRAATAESDVAAERPERALLEFSAILLYENLWYWSTYGTWAEDWQFGLNWNDQKKKLLELEGVRFDSNDFSTNWTHAAAGAAYYSIGRINNLGVKDSFLLAAFEAVYWECVVEWREVVSVNDLFMTVFGALSIGEPWYQLSRYLVTRPSPVARTLGFVHPLMGLHVLLDPTSRPRATEDQALPGYGVYLSLGAATVDAPYRSDSGEVIAIGLRSRLALPSGFTAPGTESRQGWEVLSSTANFNADIAGGETQELDVFSRAVFYGQVERNVGEDGRGSASILGLGSAFTLFRKAAVTVYDSGGIPVRQGYDLKLEEPRDFRDKYALVHLFGPVYEGYWRSPRLGVTWAVEAYPDFGMINAYALNAYSADHDISGAKTTLLYSGYYYGYGASVLARFEASAGPVTVGTAASLHYHESIEGLDRFEDQLSGDVHAADRWFKFEANLAVRIPRTALAVEVTGRWSSRRGTVGETVAAGTESRYSLGLSYRL